jgi:hypothetical protein
MEKIVKKVCECKNCGNEAEMVVTCSLPDVEEDENMVSASGLVDKQENVNRVKGTATCTHCGNEADMWVDI